eukprot:758232-Hanusia_phi.AAC.1
MVPSQERDRITGKRVADLFLDTPEYNAHGTATEVSSFPRLNINPSLIMFVCQPYLTLLSSPYPLAAFSVLLLSPPLLFPVPQTSSSSSSSEPFLSPALTDASGPLVGCSRPHTRRQQGDGASGRQKLILPQAHSSRVAASVVIAAGLQEMIARNLEVGRSWAGGEELGG